MDGVEYMKVNKKLAFPTKILAGRPVSMRVVFSTEVATKRVDGIIYGDLHGSCESGN